MLNVDLIKKEYPVGTRIEMILMKDDPRPVPPGMCGVVSHVDDIGTIHVKWDDGRLLGVVPDVDEFEKR